MQKSDTGGQLFGAPYENLQMRKKFAELLLGRALRFSEWFVEFGVQGRFCIKGIRKRSRHAKFRTNSQY